MKEPRDLDLKLNVKNLFFIFFCLLFTLLNLFIFPFSCAQNCGNPCASFGGCLEQRDHFIGFRTWPFLLSLILLFGGIHFYQFGSRLVLIKVLPWALFAFMVCSINFGSCSSWDLVASKEEPWLCPLGSTILFLALGVPCLVLNKCLCCW